MCAGNRAHSPTGTELDALLRVSVDRKLSVDRQLSVDEHAGIPPSSNDRMVAPPAGLVLLLVDFEIMYTCRPRRLR